MVEDGAFSHKIDLFTIFLESLNLKGHQNHITGLRVRAIFLNIACNGWIFTYWWSFSGGGSVINRGYAV